MPKIAAFGEACEKMVARRDTLLRFQVEGEGAKVMTGDFIQTGQTFTGDGDAFCPLERKRRSAAAIAAAVSVLVLGAGFLTLSAISTPPKGVDAPISLALAPAPVPAQTAPLTGAAPGDQPVNTNQIDDAIAQSRAARAGAKAAPINIKQRDAGVRGFWPRLKPTASVKTASAVKATSSDGFAPSLKPTTQIATAPTIRGTAPIATAPARPMQLGGYTLASDDDAPPPFFYAGDITRTPRIHTRPALTFASDLSRSPEEVRVRITRGENFVDTLKRVGISASDANEAAYAFGRHQDLRRLLPGQEFALTLGWPNQTIFQQASSTDAPSAKLMKLAFRADAENRIILRREPSGDMSAQKHAIPLTTRVMSIAGRINGSLYMSAKSVGAPDEVIANLADAFAYDVDFQREIFGGDEFEAIFEVRYDDQGKMVSAGDILYARLKWRGRAREKGYYRFSEDGERGDFYDATGQSAKRLLMKTPIDGARLSSGFGSRRHPILGYRKAHKGVDFAARRGTPIKAAGDGVVLRANRYGSFGNYLKIRHANGYETAYAHLKGFARGVRKGKRVRQGDIVAYVGTTGRSTGPHLHYEVHLNGKAVNPQRLKIATGKQLKGAELERFKAARDAINDIRMPAEEREALYARGENAASGAL